MNFSQSILLAATLGALAVMSGCIREDYSKCPPRDVPPGDILLSFHLADPFEPAGEFDTTLGNDVRLYVFQDKRLTLTESVPFGAIGGGKEYAMRKNDRNTGSIDILSWAVPAGKNLDDYLAPQTTGEDFEGICLEHTVPTGSESRSPARSAARSETIYPPLYHGLYLGTVTETTIDKPGNSTLGIGFAPACCRIEVNITDKTGTLSAVGAAPKVHVTGVMSQMNRHKQGVGTPATIETALQPSEDGENFTTGRFGVLPSGAGQTVNVTVFDPAGTAVATLSLPERLTASSGGLLTFEYELDAPFFEITIGDWTEKIFTSDHI